MGTISKETAWAIAAAHREIEVANGLLEKIADAKKWNKKLDLRDGFGREQGLTLGVPHGDGGHLLMQVSVDLAKYVIEAHVAKMHARLGELAAIARMELDGVAAAAEAPADA